MFTNHPELTPLETTNPIFRRRFLFTSRLAAIATALALTATTAVALTATASAVAASTAISGGNVQWPDASASSSAPSAVLACLHARVWTAPASAAELATCAPSAVTLSRATGSLPAGEFIVPSSHGYALRINEAGAVNRRSAGGGAVHVASASQCTDVSEWYIDPGFYNDNLSGCAYWNGSRAWTNYISTACSVWVPGVPGTSCGSNYSYEQGRNTWWDYPNGVFHMTIYFAVGDCEHLYITVNGNGSVTYHDPYGC